MNQSFFDPQQNRIIIKSILAFIPKEDFCQICIFFWFFAPTLFITFLSNLRLFLWHLIHIKVINFLTLIFVSCSFLFEDRHFLGINFFQPHRKLKIVLHKEKILSWRVKNNGLCCKENHIIPKGTKLHCLFVMNYKSLKLLEVVQWKNWKH